METHIVDQVLRTCTKCHRSFPLSGFYTNPKNRKITLSQCKMCVREISANRREMLWASGKRNRKKPEYICEPNGLRKCRVCAKEKELSSFPMSMRPNGNKQIFTRCKQCLYEHETWRKRFQKYKLTKDSYQELLRSQGYGCAICGSTTPKKNGKLLHVDHDHATGKIRGLLCSNCNVGLGNFEDKPERIRLALCYLERARGIS